MQPDTGAVPMRSADTAPPRRSRCGEVTIRTLSLSLSLSPSVTLPRLTG